MPCVPQMIAVADARQHQQLRGIQCTARQDHLAVGLNLHDLAVLAVFQAHGPHAGEDHPRRLGPGDDRQVGAAAHGPQIGGGRARAPPVADGEVYRAETQALGAVGVVVIGIAGRLARGDPGLRQWMLDARPADPHRAIAAVILVDMRRIGLGTLEIGQYLVVRPARVPQSGPAVIVGARAPVIDHAVDRAGPAQLRACQCCASRAAGRSTTWR